MKNLSLCSEFEQLCARGRAKRRGRIVSLISFLFVFLGAGPLRAQSQSQSPFHLVEQLARVLVLVENHYVQPVDRARMVEGAVKGMVAELDPHSSYLSPKEYEEFRNDTEGHFVGIGVEVDARDGLITVIRPMEGSPAERAGLRPGDQVIAIDDWPTQAKPLDQVVRRIRGQQGTPVSLLLRRPGVAQPLRVRIVRAQVHVRSVIGKRLEGNVAYVGIKQFQRGTHQEFLQVLGDLRLQRDEPLEGMILDLRANPGGLVHESAQVADELLDGGIIFTTRARGRVLDEVTASLGGAASRLPLAVLVNELTASAAELVAGAIQDHGRGLIVGAKTFGKGSVQSIVELPEGAALKLTTTLYYTPLGRTIQAEGITPGVAVQQPGSGDGFPIVREQDIEGHLASPNAAPRVSSPSTATTSEIMIPRHVPSNPVGRGDRALSIAYQLLLSDLIARKK